MEDNSLKILVEKYINNSISKKELTELLRLLGAQDDKLDHYLQTILDTEPRLVGNDQVIDDRIERIRVELMSEVRTTGDTPVRRLYNTKSTYLTAVAALLVLFFGYFFYTSYHKSDYINAYSEFPPAGNSAILTFETGEKVNLDSIESGLVYETADYKVIKGDDGKISYLYKSGSDLSARMNTMETSRGNFSEISLPDGSVVYLNSESSISYPVVFAENERKIFLKGQAYFDVQENPKKPFFVQTVGQQVRVLGTEFDVNAYNKTIKTTLVEGKVEIIDKEAGRTILSPGYQAYKVGREFHSKLVDIEEVVAWRSGKFIFNNSSFLYVLSEIERWYDVTFVFKNKIAEDISMSGSLSRKLDLSQILNALELNTGYKFEIKERSVFVGK